MNPRLADCLTLRGTAETNVKCRLKLKLLKGTMERPPQYLENTPLHFNHCMLEYLNTKAIQCGLPPPFDDVDPIVADTGEKFLAAYFCEQKERNKKHGQSSLNNQCRCDYCRRSTYPLVSSGTAASLESLKGDVLCVSGHTGLTNHGVRCSDNLSSSLLPKANHNKTKNTHHIQHNKAKPPPLQCMPAQPTPMDLQIHRPYATVVVGTNPTYVQFPPTTIHPTMLPAAMMMAPWPVIQHRPPWCYPKLQCYCFNFNQYNLRNQFGVKHDNGRPKLHDDNCPTRQLRKSNKSESWKHKRRKRNDMFL